MHAGHGTPPMSPSWYTLHTDNGTFGGPGNRRRLAFSVLRVLNILVKAGAASLYGCVRGYPAMSSNPVSPGTPQGKHPPFYPIPFSGMFVLGYAPIG